MEQNIFNMYKQILIDTLNVFDKFCVENDLRYFAAYGTAIGAIRDKGIIPWDDDIDVWMLREDYERLLSLKSVIPNGYEVIDVTTDGYYLSYAKFCDANTSIWEDKKKPFIMGVYIDVFPLDEISGDDKSAFEIIRESKLASSKLKGALTYHEFKRECRLLMGFHFGEIKRNLFDIFCCPHNKANEYRQSVIELQNCAKRINGEAFIFYNTTYPIHKEMYRKEWFASAIRIPFENITIPVPIGYDALLRQIYGDYMTPPPEKKQKSTHGHYFMDLTKRVTIEDAKLIMK